MLATKKAINDKLQGSVATHLMYGGVVNKQIKKRLLLSLRVKKNLKSVNIWQSYKQERDCHVKCPFHWGIRAPPNTLFLGPGPSECTSPPRAAS